MTYDDVHSLAGAYALDALDALERRRFEAHYPDCYTCREEVLGFRETAARLAPDAAPPPGLKERVLAEVAQTRQLPPRTEPSRRIGPLPVILAAATVIAVLAAAGLFLLRDGGPSDDGVAEIMAAADARTVDMSGGPGTLRVVYSADLGRAAVVGNGVHSPGKGHTYQLWAIEEGHAASAGVFEPHDGRVDAEVELPTHSAEAWAVTVEPDGGSPAATSGILYQGSVRT